MKQRNLTYTMLENCICSMMFCREFQIKVDLVTSLMPFAACVVLRLKQISGRSHAGPGRVFWEYDGTLMVNGEGRRGRGTSFWGWGGDREKYIQGGTVQIQPHKKCRKSQWKSGRYKLCNWPNFMLAKLIRFMTGINTISLTQLRRLVVKVSANT